MKKSYLKIVSLLFIAMLMLNACTDNFEEYNIDERRVVSSVIEADYNHIGFNYLQMQQCIYFNFDWGEGTNWTYQLTQNLNADIFSGFMMTPTAFGGNRNNVTYDLNDGWNKTSWNYTYARFMTVAKKAEELTKVDYPHFYAIALIQKVAAMHRISDQYGPIIYTKYGQSQTGGEYDSQKDVYYTFFNDLNTAVGILDDYVSEYPDAQPFRKFDLLFGGDNTKWIQFANSLRLRLAMRISNVDKPKAQSEAEAAVNNKYGTLSVVAAVSGDVYTNPLAAIANSWGDIRMGGTIESIMLGYNDPRVSKYFLPSADKDVNREGYTYKGIRQGIDLADNKTYRSHSSINLTASSPAILMTPAEVYFLRSEGALRGWNNMGGTAKELYEQGVKTSFEQWGAGDANDYLASSKVAADYIDVKRADAVNNVVAGSPYLNNVSPNYDEATTDEERLQKIITQKWLAIFPEGIEAWSEVRRTGYPKLLPVVHNYSNGKIDTEKMVKRLNFSVDDKESNPTGYQKAVQMLGGPDTGGTRLWWDTDGPNF